MPVGSLWFCQKCAKKVQRNKAGQYSQWSLLKVTPLVKGIMTGVDSIENYKGVDDAEEEEEELAIGQLQQPLLPDQLPQRPEQQQSVPPLQQMPTGPAPVQNGPVQQRVVNSNSTPMDAVVVVASRQTRRGRAVVPALIPTETYLCACSKKCISGKQQFSGGDMARCNTCKVRQVKKVHVNKYYICVYCQLDKAVDDDEVDETDDDEYFLKKNVNKNRSIDLWH
jgi:hypothetical protein